MGCVATKTDISHIFNEKYFDRDETDDSNSGDRTTRADSCELYEHSSRLSKETMSLSKSDKERVENRTRKNSKHTLTRNPNACTYKLSGPGFDENNYEVVCEQKSIPVFIHLMHGFPAENVDILSITSPEERKLVRANRLSVSSNDSQKQKEIHGIWTKGQFVNLILKPNVSIFVTVKLSCPLCHSSVKSTHCRAVFPVHSNCTCKADKLKVVVLSVEPPLLQVWSDNTKSILPKKQSFGGEDGGILIRRKSKLRVFGCTSCWGFSQLSKRGSCPCGVCSKCQGFSCQICQR